MKPLEIMKKTNLNKFLAAGLALAGIGLASSAPAQTEILIGGGNATQALLYDRVTNLLAPGYTLKTASTSPPVSTYIGTISGLPGLGTVTIDFSLLGGVQGLQDLASQTAETTAYGNQVVPALAVSSASPTASAVDPSQLTGITTLEVGYAYVKNATNSPALANVTNLTERQAYYFEGANGPFFPAVLLGGSSTTTPVYLVARNTASAVRTEIDANIYFTGQTIQTWTNSGVNIIPDPAGGQSSGSGVRTLLAAITNSIGTVAFSDIKTETPLSFEGVSASVANIQNGSYPLWYYEQWFTNNTPNPALSPNQYALIGALLSAYTNTSYQASNTNFTGGLYVPLANLPVYRNSDGGVIYSSQY
jgi:hypothetical protein